MLKLQFHVVLLCLLLLLHGTASSLIPQIDCLYMTRQADNQVVIYRDVPNPKHPEKLGVEAGTDIASFKTHPVPTGVTIHGDFIYVASYGNMAAKRKVNPFEFLTFPSLSSTFSQN